MSDEILLIDAYSQIYRGFYALPPFRNKSGQATNAVFAVAKFLLNIEQKYPSSFGAMVFDLGKCEKRISILPEYKSNRPPMPDDLKAQIPYIKDWVTAMGWPIVEYENTEADDLIGALAAASDPAPVSIVTSDKDIAQIVDDRVGLLVPSRKGGLSRIGPDEVRRKYKVGTEQIVDYLALIGDSSDNIKGVSGVGPKTAAKLLEQFGSAENMLASIEDIEKDSLKEKIRDSADLIRKNISLIGLDLSFPEENWPPVKDMLRKRTPDIKSLENICDELGMNSIKKQLENFPAAREEDCPTPPLENEPGTRETGTDPDQESLFTPDLFGE